MRPRCHIKQRSSVEWIDFFDHPTQWHQQPVGVRCVPSKSCSISGLAYPAVWFYCTRQAPSGASAANPIGRVGPSYSTPQGDYSYRSGACTQPGPAVVASLALWVVPQKKRLRHGCLIPKRSDDWTAGINAPKKDRCLYFQLTVAGHDGRGLRLLATPVANKVMHSFCL